MGDDTAAEILKRAQGNGRRPGRDRLTPPTFAQLESDARDVVQDRAI